MIDTKQQLLNQVLKIADSMRDFDLFESDSILDITYSVASDGSLLGATLLVAYGGPTIEINTRHNQVTGYWGNDKIGRSFENNRLLDEQINELYRTLKCN